MRYLLNTSHDPFFNTAFDSYVLENTRFEGFYLWQNKPSVIVGMNQSVYAEVNLPYIREHGIELVRRVSGGGAVYHDLGNVNYTFIGYEDGPSRIAESLRRMGVPAELTGRNDIMVDGRKCSGYAKRLAAGRIMVHGTLMFNVNLEDLTGALAAPGSKLSASGVKSVRSRVANLKEYLPFDTVEGFIQALSVSLLETTGTVTGGEGGSRYSQSDGGPSFPDLFQESLSERQLAEIESVASSKFRSWEWIYGHSPSSEFRNSKRFPCGTVTVNYSLNRGRLKDVSFEGDFIGPKPASELAAAMAGRRIEDLMDLKIDDYFDNLSITDFLKLF